MFSPHVIPKRHALVRTYHMRTLKADTFTFRARKRRLQVYIKACNRWNNQLDSNVKLPRIGKCCGLVISPRVFDSGLRGLGVSLGRGCCVAFLGKLLCPDHASLYTDLFFNRVTPGITRTQRSDTSQGSNPDHSSPAH